MESEVQQVVSIITKIYSLFSKWCSHCSQLQKRAAKKLRQEEFKKRKEQLAQDQNEMLEKARQEMLKQQFGKNTICELDTKASQMTSNYLIENPSEVNVQDIFILYKVILSPIDLLIKQM